MTVVRFPEDRYMIHATNRGTFTIFCTDATCTDEQREDVYESDELLDLGIPMDQVYAHERKYHSG